MIYFLSEYDYTDTNIPLVLYIYRAIFLYNIICNLSIYRPYEYIIVFVYREEDILAEI